MAGRTSARAKELLRAARQANAEAAMAAIPPQQETVELPVHHRVAVDAGGDATSTSTVFCRRRGGATDVATCAGCSHVVSVPKPADSGVGVRCSQPMEIPHKRDASELAMRTYVGEVMRRNVLCVRAGTSDAQVPLADDGPAIAVDAFMRPVGDEQTLPETAPLSLAIGLLAQKGCTHATVVAADGAVVGIVTANEIVGWLAQRLGYER